MRIDSALELQMEIFSKIFGFVEMPSIAEDGRSSPGRYLDPFLLEARRPRPYAKSVKKRDAEDIALGITTQNADAKLAVLVQDRRKMKCATIGEIVRRAKGEAEVLYIGRQRPLWTTVRNDPIRLGCSISPTTVEHAGTLGCFCRDDQTGQEALLSNNHVLADVNRVTPTTPIMQPGALDGGEPGRDNIATLTRFVPIQFEGIPNTIDAAVAVLSDHERDEDRDTFYGSADEPEPALAYKPESFSEAVPDMEVFKVGRTTRFTRGRVRAVNVNNYLVDMGSGLARFDSQIVIEANMSPIQPFSRPGDSGSIIVDDVGHPVGLLFSGSASGGAGNVGFTGANPISSVVQHLGVTLI